MRLANLLAAQQSLQLISLCPLFGLVGNQHVIGPTLKRGGLLHTQTIMQGCIKVMHTTLALDDA